MCVHIAAPSSVKAVLRALLQAQPEAVPVGHGGPVSIWLAYTRRDPSSSSY